MKELREQKGLSQSFIAEKIGVSVVAYHLYETGQRKIPVKKAQLIAEILGVDIKDIFLPSTFSLR